MTREELEQQIRGMIGPRYWVLDTLMELIDEYRDDQVTDALQQYEQLSQYTRNL